MKNYCHGGDIFEYKKRFGRFPLDFSVNVNPLPLPQSVKNAYLQAFDFVGIYPDHASSNLCEKIVDYENVHKEYILCGNGASDLIYKIFIGLKPTDVLVTAPTFSEYIKAAQLIGSSILFHHLIEENNFAVTDKLLENIGKTGLLVLCNPNNPTSKIIDVGLIENILEKCCENGVIVVVDECFGDFCKDFNSCAQYLHKYDNLIIIKAFTKIFHMAGLRLGYCLSSNREYLGKIEAAGQSWSVSTPAMTCGEAVLEEKEYLKRSIDVINKEKSYLVSELKKFPLKIYNYEANFIFFRSDFCDLDKKLEKYGILIRNCHDFVGLSSNFYRIGVRLHDDNKTLIEALKNEFTR